MTEFLASWARSKEQICDFCGTQMVQRDENYLCPGCNNARQLALILWLRKQIRRA